MRGALAVMVAASILVLTALVPLSSDSDASEAQSFDTLRIRFDNTSSSSLYVIWDFGDGTVLDGRWERYAGDTSLLTSDQKAMLAEYQSILSAHGGDIDHPVHEYAEAGTYAMSVTAINPIGRVDAGGHEYTAENSIDYSSFDGGLFSTSTAKSARGSWDVSQNTITVSGSASGWTDWLPFIIIATGAIVAAVGLRYHPAIMAAGIAVAVMGALCLLGVVDLRGMLK